ncbi:hypothetical protein FRC11_011058, partial [Ceratobasidium sp. 423]
AGIVQVESHHDPPPDTHIPGLAGHHETSRLDHGNNKSDDIVASTVDTNLEASSASHASPRLQIGINSIHVFIVILIISVTASASRSLSYLLGVEQAGVVPLAGVRRRGPGRAVGQFMP